MVMLGLGGTRQSHKIYQSHHSLDNFKVVRFKLNVLIGHTIN